MRHVSSERRAVMDVLGRSIVFQPTALYGPLRKFPDEVDEMGEVYWELWNALGVPCIRIDPPEGDPRCAVLFLHGNAGTINASRDFALHIARVASARVFAIEYPGYWLETSGKCREQPSAAALYKAATESAQFVRSVTDRQPLCIIGYSLGCSLASRVAKSLGNDAQGLVLVSPMTSLAGVASDVLGLKGMGWLTSMMDTFKTEEDARACFQNHAIVIHSQTDEVIRCDHGARCDIA